MAADAYEEFSERYDWMSQEDPLRTAFFRNLFGEYNVHKVLDCACGTGSDLLMFHSMNLDTYGSDLSESMLAQAQKKTANTNIELQKADFCYLPDAYSDKFDAIVCLNNSINEVLKDSATLRALRSMRSVLETGGLLVIDQGQSDASMRTPPRFAPIVNNRDFTRLFAMDYSPRIMTVSIFDFIHTGDEFDFKHHTVRIRIRLLDSWSDILREAGFGEVDFYGDWTFTRYDKEISKRLIAVARK
jgi:glycine/sarcosine N-methyltransferase